VRLSGPRDTHQNSTDLMALADPEQAPPLLAHRGFALACGERSNTIS